MVSRYIVSNVYDDWSETDMQAAVTDPQGWSVPSQPHQFRYPTFVHRSGVSVFCQNTHTPGFVVGNRDQNQVLYRTCAPFPSHAPHAFGVEVFQDMLEWSFCSPAVGAVVHRMAAYILACFPNASGVWLVSPEGHAWPEDDAMLMDLRADPYFERELRRLHPELIACLVAMRFDTHYLALPRDPTSPYMPYVGNPDSVVVQMPTTAHGKALLLAQARALGYTGE